MQLAHNWRELIKHAWSLKFLALSILLGAAELALPYLHGVLPVRPGTFALLVLITNIAATVARLINQRNL